MGRKYILWIETDKLLRTSEEVLIGISFGEVKIVYFLNKLSLWSGSCQYGISI